MTHHSTRPFGTPQARRAERAAAVPRVEFNNELPVTQLRETIARAIAEHQVVVVCGETGSGKSTQLPKICLSLGRGIDGMIGHTQPRRIAARSVAARIADELRVPLGQAVGYKIRFTDATNPLTLIKLMTDGVLLAESQADPLLRRYDTLIVDEAHERSLNIDFLLGYLKRLLPQRPDLKLIVTSATIDARRFAEHFSSAGRLVPIIDVPGRMYPVEIRYRPPASTGGTEADALDSVVDAVQELAREGPGDMLVFLPTEREIHQVVKRLRGLSFAESTEVVPLYARLPNLQQQRIFTEHEGRRIVLSTNVAESSLTVPGVRYVIDTGTARISRYAARSKVRRLPIEPISQASADQRAGRCGRVGPGICIRLYSEADYQSRPAFTAPEMQRSDLAAVILQALSLGLGPIEEFPFLDAPRPESLRDGYRTLYELRAIDEEGNLTELGESLARLPADPRIARIIVAGAAEGCLHEVLIIAAALEVQDPRDRPAEQQQAADDAHARYANEHSDFLSYLSLWDHALDLKQQYRGAAFRRACRDEFLSSTRLFDWFEVHRQLRQLAAQAGLPIESRRRDAGAIHRALLTGFLSNLATRCSQNEYLVAGGQRAWLWPGSGLFERRPAWVVAGEVVETSRRYLRTVARIQSSWVEPLAEHLVERTDRDPYWDPKLGAAMARQRVRLWGLTLVSERCVRLAASNAELARDLFIEHGLTRGDMETRGNFLEHNQLLLRDLRAWQHKLRQPDLLRGFDARLDFYDRRIPLDVVDVASFERWRVEAERVAPRLLYMSADDLCTRPFVAPERNAYPDLLLHGSLSLPLEYRYEPAAGADGVTVVVPAAALAQLDPKRLDWLVPGMLAEKVVALIKSLPKPLRMPLLPAPDTAQHAVAAMQFGKGVFAVEVARQLSRLGGVGITASDFQPHRVPEYLQMRVRVVDASGRTIASGRDLAAVRRQVFADVAADLPSEQMGPWTRTGLTTWDFDALPAEVEIRTGGMTVVGFPTVADRQTSVALQLAASPGRAEELLRGGVRRLAWLALRSEVNGHVAWLPRLREIRLWSAGVQFTGGIDEQLALLVVDRALFVERAVPRTRSDYASALEQARPKLGLAVQDVVAVVVPLFDELQRTRLALETEGPRLPPEAFADLHSQWEQLAGKDFLLETPWQALCQYPRYLRGMQIRVERLIAGGQAHDSQGMSLVRSRWLRYLDLARQHRLQQWVAPELERYRWLIEEYRVSLFAQKLGTAERVSEKRLDEQWHKVPLA